MRNSPVVPRRRFVFLAAAAAAAPLAARNALAAPGPVTRRPAPRREGAIPDSFPRQDPAVVREVVGVAHGDFARVRELVDARPALARAAWDWGFGDWESALGAASHTGNRDIALYLIEHGARPSLFSAAMLGQLEVVRAFCTAQLGAQSIPGPHGIPLLTHARLGGPDAEAVVQYLGELGGADGPGPAAPLDASLQAGLHGTYAWGQQPDERLIVDDSSRGQLQIRRADAVARGLRHLGDAVFHPAGAPDVEVRFTLNGERGARVAIGDGEMVLVAERLE